MKDLKKFEEVRKTCKKEEYTYYGDTDYVYDYYDCLTLIDLKFDDKKHYACTKDFQGGNWAVGCCLTAKGWAERALEWCDSDGYLDTITHLIDNCNEEELIEEIIDIWQIWIEPIRPLNDFEESYVLNAIEERCNNICWYVLRYDTETTFYNNDIEFLTLSEALDKFNETSSKYPSERIELIFAPRIEDEEFSENAVVSYKLFGE